ncbi:tail fiber protein [Sphingomonas sp. HF-S3]|uniref:Tail fiber protein n=1 Tax=Sphingomonas rustica TaxID=3103142 RepID=A0ABV0B9P4_9SPHN
MDPFIGEIRAIAFSFPPRGWIPCDGRLLSVSQYSPLFAIIGITYGGNGTTTFAVPNLQGLALTGQGTGPGLSPYALADVVGETSVQLTTDQLPAHTHPAVIRVNSTGIANMHTVPQLGDQLSRFATPTGPGSAFNTPPLENPDTFAPGMVMGTGSDLAHDNQQPYLSMTYCIAAQGIFPSRN